MDDQITTPARRGRTIAWATGLLATGAVAGGILAATNVAGAQTPTPTAPAPAAADDRADRHPGGQRAGETLLTGDNAATARAAALKAVPGGTVDRVETDADGAVYEAHMTKADGSHVTVKFDKDFTVTAIQDGMGAGGHAGAPAGGSAA